MSDEQPIYNIVGERVALGPLERRHAPDIQRWYNDYATMRTLAFLPGPCPSSNIDALFDGIISDPMNVLFAIYERETGRFIGVTLLYKVDHINRGAEFGIMIGPPDCRGRGYGAEATRLTLDHAFLAMGLSNVFLRVWEFNLAGIHAYEKAGFKQFGVRRKSKLMGGKLWDTVYMEALADEFESPVLSNILVPDPPRGPDIESGNE